MAKAKEKPETRKGSRIPVGKLGSAPRDLSFNAGEPTMESGWLCVVYNRADGSREATLKHDLLRNLRCTQFHRLCFDRREVIERHFDALLPVRLSKLHNQLKSGEAVDAEYGWALYKEAAKELERLRGKESHMPPKENLPAFDAINPLAHEIQRLLRIQSDAANKDPEFCECGRKWDECAMFDGEERHADRGAPPIAGTADTEYESRIDAERCTAEFGTKSTRRLDAGRKPIEDSPLFGGERQMGLF